jgi:hemoglobin
VSLFDVIGGTPACRQLSKVFYGRVDRDPLLRPLFPGTTLRCAIEEFAAFLVQFLGGPSEESQVRWWVSLHESHRRFRIEPQHRDAWLRHMDEALKDVGIAETARGALRSFFEVASAHMIDGKPEARRLSRELGRRWAAQRAVDAAVAAIRKGERGPRHQVGRSVPVCRSAGLAGTHDR